MPYIIDGHNLIGRLPSISLSDTNDEQQLISILGNYFKQIRKKAIVYFDHASLTSFNHQKSAFLDVIFVRAPKTADEAIIEYLISQRGNAKNYYVVSSDNWIIKYAKKYGAKAIFSEVFGKKIVQNNQTPQKQQKNGENNIDYWIKIFESDS